MIKKPVKELTIKLHAATDPWSAKKFIVRDSDHFLLGSFDTEAEAKQFVERKLEADRPVDVLVGISAVLNHFKAKDIFLTKKQAQRAAIQFKINQTWRFIKTNTRDVAILQREYARKYRKLDRENQSLQLQLEKLHDQRDRLTPDKSKNQK